MTITARKDENERVPGLSYQFSKMKNLQMKKSYKRKLKKSMDFSNISNADDASKSEEIKSSSENQKIIQMQILKMP